MELNPLRWFSPRNADTYSIGDDAVLRAFYGALANISGSSVCVTQESAMRCTAVLACLLVRAETFAALPVHVFRSQGRENIADEAHPGYRLLAIAPNDLMTAGEFWRWKQLAEDVSGNAYARIVWRGAFYSEPAEIWPLTGPKPELFVDSTTHAAAYRYAGDTAATSGGIHGTVMTPANVYPVSDILHFKGPVLSSPHEGRSLIDLASETIGITIGSEQFFARLLSNGSHFPGYLETDAVLKDADVKALAAQMKEFAGILRAGEMRIFDRGLKYKQNEMSLKDAQLTEQMRWQLQMICSIFRMPLAMVQDLTNGTYTNSEQQDLWLAKHTITPICVATEAVIRHKLFVKTPGTRLKFNLDGLLRGDYATRTAGDATLVNAGVILRNEARGHYDLNPLPGLDTPLAALNLGTVSEDGTITGPDQGTQSAPTPAAAIAMLNPLMRDAGNCIRKRYADANRGKRGAAEAHDFALARLAPLAEAHARAGLWFDAEAFIAQALSGTGDTVATLEQEVHSE